MAVEQYPLWKKEEASKYKTGSKVYWVDPTTKIGYGFKANSVYTDGQVNHVVVDPPLYSGWTFDPNYAIAWNAKEKYVTGSRVLFDVGDSTKNTSREYIYVASPRYFGGTEPPNEEEDEDGIRTWNIYYKPKKLGNISPYFLVPFKKTFEVSNNYGFYSWQNQCGSPEDFVNMLAETSNAEVYKNEYAVRTVDKINSVFEGNPYDEYVYEFYRLGTDGKKIYHKKGIHRGEAFKKLSSTQMSDENKRLQTVAKRQWWFTAYQTGSYYDNFYPFFSYSYNYGYLDYSNANYGFSVEMWPDIQDGEYETTVHNHRAFYFNYLGYAVGPRLVINSNGVSMFGGETDPAGREQPASEDKDCFLKIAVNIYNQAFANRSIELKLLITNSSYYYVIDGYNEDGSVNYHAVQNPDQYYLRKGVIDTNETSYKFKDWIVKDGVVQVNLSSLKRPRCYTTARIVSARIV